MGYIQIYEFCLGYVKGGIIYIRCCWFVYIMNIELDIGG